MDDSDDNFEYKPVSNCNIGCKIPLLWVFGITSADEVPVTQESLLAEISKTPVPSGSEYATEVLPVFEDLLDSFGLECVVFLASGAKSPTGKKCVVRSPSGEGRGEIRLR